MSLWMKWALVALGGAMGAMLRTGVSEGMFLLWGRSFIGTLCVNVVGCAVMGGARTAVELYGWGSPQVRLLLFAGFLGAFTTFSTFEADGVELWRAGNALGAALYVVGSVTAGVLAFMLGSWLVSRGVGSGA